MAIPVVYPKLWHNAVHYIDATLYSDSYSGWLLL